ncbi:MAG: inorganic diphosphatase [Bacteroidota bacterium]
MHRVSNKICSVYVLWLLLGCCLLGCKREQGFDKPRRPYQISTIAEGGELNMIVEIPAGTNEKFEYDSQLRKFVQDTLSNGINRRIGFLPYPGNYGFIPSTMMDEERGGDGDPLDILVIGQYAPRGSLLAVAPIATLLLRDNGELDTKIIAVPADPNLRTLPTSNYIEFLFEYPAAHRIIEDWFLNYKGPNEMELIRWEDEAYAWQEIEKWKKKS